MKVTTFLLIAISSLTFVFTLVTKDIGAFISLGLMSIALAMSDRDD